MKNKFAKNKKFYFQNINLCVFFAILTFFSSINTINCNDTNGGEIKLDEIQTEMLNFMDKLKKLKDNQEKVINQNGVQMKKIIVNEVYDLSSPLKPYFNLFNKIQNRKINEKEENENKLKLMEVNIKETSDKLKLLQAKYDTVIAQSELASKDLSEKKKKQIEIISELDSIKSNFELENEKFLNSLKESDLKKDLDKQNPIKEYNSSLKSLYSNLNQRKEVVSNFKSSKKQVAIEEANLDHYETLKKSSTYDEKLFSLINKNIIDNTLKFRQEIDNKINSIEKNKKQLNQNISTSLIAEKRNSEEMLANTKKMLAELNKKIKNENIEMENFLKKKQSLRSKYDKITIEQDIKRKEIQSKMTKLEEEIEKIETNKALIVKEQAKVIF